MNHLYIVTHTDLDGVGAAAAVVRLLGRVDDDYTVVYAEPYNLDEKLSRLAGYVEKGDLLIVSDLGPNRDSYRGVLEAVSRIVKEGGMVEWYDHHVWSSEDMERLRELGVWLVVDRSTCATGVVMHHLSRRHGVEPDEYLLELERVVCSADLWRWDHYLSTKLFRVVGSEQNGDEWRDKVLGKLASGTLWDGELEERLQDYMTRELEGFNRVQATVYVYNGRGCRVAAALKHRGPPANSFVGGMLIGRYMADIAVILRPNGGLSLRSRSVDVQVVASRLGGGGHPRAAGAKIRIPLWARLAAAIYPRILSWYASRLVYKTAREAGVCGSGGG